MHKRSLLSALAVAGALSCLFFVGGAHASYTVDPAMVTIRANMGENMAWVDLIHGGSDPIAIELSVLERPLDLDGEFVVSGLPVSRDWTVYPSQVILRPRERARVQVTFNGKQRNVDRAYHLYSREVRLPIDEGGAEGVGVAVHTATSYYTPLAIDAARPGRLSFVSSRMIEPGKVEVIVANRSNGRVQAANLVLTIGGREKITEFTGRKNSIMPGQQRRFTFSYGRALSAREVSFGYK